MAELYEISVSRDSAAVTRAAFSNVLVLGASNRFSERYRVYDLTGASPLAEMEADGFLATDAEHRAVTRLVASDTRPEKVVVGRALNRPTQVWKVTPYQTLSSTAYALLVGDDAEDVATFTSDASATLAEITAGLAAAVTTLALPGVTAADAGTHVTLTLSTPGAFLRLEPLNRNLLSVEQVHADPGVAADLSDLLLAVEASNGAADWYAFVLTHASTATALAAAAWAETNKRLFLLATNDTRAVRAPVGGNADVITQLMAFSYEYTAVIWHHDVGQYADAGWAGRCLPLPAGTETWHAKTIGGLEVSNLTGGEKAQLQARRTAYYAKAKGVSLTLGEPGAQTLSGEYIDNRRGLDEMVARLGEDYVAATADVDEKVPYDDSGFQQLAGIFEGTLRDYESTKGSPRLLRAGTIVVTVPRLSEVSSADRQARRVPITFEAELAQAAHKAVLRGVVR